MSSSDTYRHGVECPECGDTNNKVTITGRDDDMNKLRQRKCSNCSQLFTTVEVPVVDSYGNYTRFSQLDTEYRMRQRDWSRKNRGYKGKTGLARPITDPMTLSVRTKVYPSKRDNNERAA